MSRVAVRVAVFAAGAVLIASCLRDIGGPGAQRRARMALAPAFVGTGAAIVDFDRIRVTVERGICSSTDGPTSTRARPAVDTIVPFPAGVDSIELALVVPLEAPREEFLIFVRLITAQGDTVFRNVPYPQCVVAVAGGPSAVLATLLEYVGVGANATSVVITSLDSLLSFGATLDLAATALDATGKPIPGTPIVWSSLDPQRVAVPDAGVARILGGSQRGPARIVARLLTGHADTTLITAQPLPSVLAIQSGDGQTGIPGLPLPLPLRVRVTGPDDLGVQVPVTFRPLIPGASVRDPVVLSDVNGFAETVGILPLITSLTPAFEASVSGVPTVVFSGLALTNVAQVIVTPSAAGLDVLGGTVQYVAAAKDSTGQPLTRTFAWSSSDGSVATVDPATGLVTALGNGTAAITATAEGVSGGASFTVLQRVAQLAFTTLPSDAVAGAPITPAVQVAALDPGGSVATNFTGPVTLTRADVVSCSGPLGTLTVPAVAGVATFSDLAFQQACPGLQLQATADTLSSPVSSAFSVLPGPAAVLSLVNGGGVTDTVRATVPTLSVRVTDQYGNGVPGHPVLWSVPAGFGQLAVSGTGTDTSGYSFADWILGTTAGANAVEAKAAGLSGSPVLFTATATPATASQLVFAVPPSDALALQIIAPPVEVVVRDQFGNTVTNWSASVTMALGRNPLGTGLLLGTTLVVPVSGVAKFDNLLVDPVAAGYTLLATSSGIPTEESRPFNINLLPAGAVFGGDSASGQASGVFTATPDGANHTRLSPLGLAGEVYPRWSPDRTLVAFSSDDQGGGPNVLYVVKDLAEQALVVSDTSTRRPRWNPEGIHLAFECGPKSAPQDVCVITDAVGPVSALDRRGEGSGKIFVTDFTGDRLDGPGSFVWDPLDPKRLIVVRDSLTDQSLVASRLWYVNFDGAAALELSPPVMDAGKGPLKIEGPLDITPDGGWIVFSARDPAGTRSLFAIDRDGKNMRPLTAGPDDRAPVISPDGREALFIRDLAGSTDYWRVTLADGIADQVSNEGWRDFTGDPFGYDWSPDGKDIVLVGGNPPGLGDFAIYTIPAATTKGTYLTDRRLIGRVGESPGLVKDIQPSWRP